MTKIAVLGTGHMGKAIALRLIATGHDVTVWNRTPERAAPLVSAASPAAAVEGADVVITMLADGPAVAAVLDEARTAVRTGAVVVQMSTIGPDEVADLARRWPGPLVDAPVGGSVGAAEAGTLTIFAGGDVAPVEPVLRALGTVVRCGDVGAGAALKLVVNTGMVTALAALRDALAVAESLGVDRAAALEALARGPLGGAVQRATPTAGSSFAISLAAKDVRLALRAAPAPLAAAALTVLEAAPDPAADVAALMRSSR